MVVAVAVAVLVSGGAAFRYVLDQSGVVGRKDGGAALAVGAGDGEATAAVAVGSEIRSNLRCASLRACSAAAAIRWFRASVSARNRCAAAAASAFSSLVKILPKSNTAGSSRGRGRYGEYGADEEVDSDVRLIAVGVVILPLEVLAAAGGVNGVVAATAEVVWFGVSGARSGGAGRGAGESGVVMGRRSRAGGGVGLTDELDGDVSNRFW